VVPNYFDVSEWKLNINPNKNRLVYFGRLSEIKGLDIVHEIARQRPDLEVVICGQGDPSRWMNLPNIVYQEPLHGIARSDFLGNALAVLMPTRYVEPFGGVTIEAHLCGTPVLGSSYGSFTETITHGVNGFRCRTLGDYLTGIKIIEQDKLSRASKEGKLYRASIRFDAIQKYGMYKVAHQYDAAFKQITDLQHKGWYTSQSYTARSMHEYQL
jgi:glycosyltransferase involved in cell wall biosynthesis